MRILEAQLEHAHYARDFGQVEALVSFLVKAPGRPVPHIIRIRTSEPVFGGTTLRQRLIASAKRLLLARHMDHTQTAYLQPGQHASKPAGLAPAA